MKNAKESAVGTFACNELSADMKEWCAELKAQEEHADVLKERSETQRVDTQAENCVRGVGRTLVAPQAIQNVPRKVPDNESAACPSTG